MALVTLSTLLPNVAASQDNESDHRDEIVVVGQLEESILAILSKFGNRMVVITGEEIQLAGFGDLTQALQMMVPGFYVSPKNGAFDYVSCSLQGSRCEDVLWLIDGVRINNRLYNSTTPLDTVPAHIVERIEVLYGGQGVFYGTQSVSGVVNVVTKAFGTESQGSIGFGYGNNAAQNINAEYRTSFATSQVVAYGSIDRAEGFQPFLDEDYQPSGTDRNRGYDVLTAGIKYGLDISEKSRLSVAFHHVQNEVEWAAPANTERSYNEREENLLSTKWDYKWSDDHEMFVKAYLHRWDSYWTSHENELDQDGTLTGNVLVVSDREYWGYKDYGIVAQTDIRGVTGIDVSVGYELQQYAGRDDVLIIDDRTEKTNAIYGQIRASDELLANSVLAAGVRYSKPDGESDVAVWNVSGKHNFSDFLYVRGTVGTSYRLPDAWQLYGNDPCCALGNPDLRSEHSANANVAVGGEISISGGIDWGVTAFRRRVDDLIGSGEGVRINTKEQVNISGLDISVALHFRNGFLASANYVHTKARLVGSNQQIDNIPQLIAKLLLNYSERSSPFSAVLSLVHTGDVYNTVAGGIGRTNFGHSTVVDLGLAWYLANDRKHRIGVRVENAFDEEYASSLGRAFRDSDGTSYMYRNLGMPRTFHVSYLYSF